MNRLLLPALALLISISTTQAQAPLLDLPSPAPETSGRFGAAVAGVPDVDGDGRGDFVVGAPFEGDSTENAGRAYVFSGATGSLLHTLVSENPESNGLFGAEVAGTADLDGDGRCDLLVGAFEDEVGLPLAGRVYVFSGATGAPLRTLVSPSPQGGGRFIVPTSVPDADGDGVADILVGAGGEDTVAVAAGRAYLFSGATGALLHTLASPSPQFSGAFGATVAGLPDMDGDGDGDVLIGAAGEDVVVGAANRADAGRVYVLSGATGNIIHALISPDPERLALFGSAVAAVEDADGDGVGDLAVGALREDAAGTVDAGRVHLFSGATGALLHTFVSPNPTATGVFGGHLSGVPDVDGDGRGDVLAGADFEEGFAGRAYVFSGRTGALLLTLASPGAVPSGRFGSGVAGVADADGDGRGDLLVGASDEPVGDSTRAGRAYLFSGFVATAGEPEARAPALKLTVSPNPTRGAATITFDLVRPSPARLTVYDMLGRTVAVVVDGDLPAGRGVATLDVARLAPGSYIARLIAREGAATVRFTVTR